MSRQAFGMRTWMLQRITAVYLAGYFIFLISWFIISPPREHADWLAWVSSPLNGVGLLLFIAALLQHAWVGIRDVLIDYVQTFSLRLILLSLFGFGLTACGLWAMRIILAPLVI